MWQLVRWTVSRTWPSSRILRRGRPRVADLRGDLADELLVDAAHQDLGLGGCRDLHAFGHLPHHRVREAERQVQFVALRLGTVTDADQVELFLEALGHAGAP